MSKPMKFVYVASPYSDKDKGIMYKRAVEAEEFVSRYYSNDLDPKHFLYSPIAYTAMMERNFGLPSTYEFWMKIDLAAIHRFDEVWVLMLDGIENSKGVRAEIEYAQKIGRPIRLVHPGYAVGTLMTKNDALEFGWTWWEW